MTRFLPVFIWLVLACALFSHHGYASEPGEGLRFENADAVRAGTNDQSFHRHYLAALPDDPKRTGDPAESNVPENPEDTESREEKEETEDAFWISIYKYFVRSTSRIEESQFFALTKSVQNRKVLPLFLLHSTWTSFLS